MKNNNKINAKDLINVGLFTILLSLVTMVASFIGFFPVFMPYIPVICGLLTAPIFMLYCTKIKKPGMFFITLLLMGTLFAVTGHGFWTVASYGIMGLVGEVILKKGHYNSIKASRYAISISSIACMGQMLPMYLNRTAYMDTLIEQGYGKEYALQLLNYMPSWSFFPILILGVIATYLGCTLGIKMLKKHFVKAGMVEDF